MSRKFDIIIFGATGFTGRYVIEELANSTRNGEKKWAIAGRNSEKLKESLTLVQKYLPEGFDIMNTPIIVADVKDKGSIDEMCKQAKLIMNCVGPYKFYGETVVSSCVKNQTHHVDLSGEVKYLDNMQVKYFKEAQDKNAYIVQACGFDSIPNDYGIALMKQRFEGDLNSVESFVEFGYGKEGRVLNSGTWISAVNSVTDFLSASKYNKDLKSVFDKDLPKAEHPMPMRFPLFYSPLVKGWCLLFIGPDDRIVYRSQRFAYQFLNERPVQSKIYLNVKSFLTAALMTVFMAWFGFLSFFPPGRYLLEKYPSFFSAGMFSHQGPTRKQVEGASTKVTLYGRGWSEKSAEPTDKHQEKPNKKIKLEINGPEPAYALTSICMVQSALTILDETDKLPLSGGVLTPGVAFARTNLLDRLQRRGVSFQFSPA